jgi:hypothetical protein
VLNAVLLGLAGMLLFILAASLTGVLLLMGGFAP